jgi:hypothetical protein
MWSLLVLSSMKKQDVVRLEEKGLDGEEVAGQNTGGMGAEELGPGGSPPRRRVKPDSAKERGDRGGRDLDAQAEELTSAGLESMR